MLFSTDFLALEIDWLLRLFSRALPMLLKSSIIFEEARDLAMPRSLAWLWCHPKNNGQSNVGYTMLLKYSRTALKLPTKHSSNEPQSRHNDLL
jgi:hypothetical protein